MTIEELVSRVFAVRNAAHLAHWATDSFSRHMALGDFYDKIIDQIDGIVETYQGYYGLMGDVAPMSFPYDDICGLIADEAEQVAKARSTVCKGNTALENLIDGLSETYSTTFYKLANLK
jgi:hypothetical protein